MARSFVRCLSLCATLLSPVPALADGPSASDPFFGEALFHAYQGNFFEALERLDSELAQHYGVDERNLDTLYPVLDHAEFSVGDFELRYRMHHRAGRAIRAVLGGEVEASVKADASYRLAEIHYQKDQSEKALTVLDAMAEPKDERLRNDVAFLRANVLLALDRPEEAIKSLRTLKDAEALRSFSAYNLGIALLEQGNPEAAILQLNRAGKLRAESREDRAIRDKANLVLGGLLQDAGKADKAVDALERIRLSGPYSNLALLRAGWSEISAEQFERAVVPWSILADRDATDAAVQEAKLALPFAYSKLNVHSRAAVLYERAVNSFGGELVKLDASLESVREGDFLRALEREEIRQDKDWVIQLRSLSDSPETFYLVSLMASHEFQTALQNYLDLADMRRKLLEWQRSLDAFDDIIHLRNAYYSPRVPEIDQHFRKLDAQMRVRLEQRRNLNERLTSMLTAPSPHLLASAEEHTMRMALRSYQDQLTGREDRQSNAARVRIKRLQGVLEWRLETEYHDRLTQSHEHLRELNADVLALETQYENFVRTRQAASHSYVGYTPKIGALRKRVGKALTQLATLRKRQGQMLEQVALRELQTRRDRLEAYQNKARFAFADSYDRAAKQPAR